MKDIIYKLLAVIGFSAPISAGAQNIPPPAPPQPAEAIAFAWACELREPSGNISELTGEFDANALNQTGSGGPYVRSKVRITKDLSGRFQAVDYVYKDFSFKGMAGKYTVIVRNRSMPSYDMYFEFFGFEETGIVRITQPGSNAADGSRAVAIGFCRQRPLNAQGSIK